MITLSQLTELLGWASVINISYLLLATTIIVFMRGEYLPFIARCLGWMERNLTLNI